MKQYNEDPTINIWKNFLKYIHKKNIGDYIYRRELVKKKYVNSHSTIDSYRKILDKLGILETVKPGIYIKKKNIKTDWSLNVLKKIAYEDTWKSWFYKFD